MTFAQPKLLYFLLLLPALAGLRAWASWQARRKMDQLTAPRLRDSLVFGVSGVRSTLIFTLQLLALGGFIIALAQPRWGEDRIIQSESGRNVIIAIDTSRSMLATDIAPDRLTRAKLAAQDLLGSLKGDRIGLIAFAGNAYLQAPLTTDHEAVIEAIESLDFTSVPRGGSELGRALSLAMETFEKNPARNHGLILFSDGGEPDAEVRQAAEKAAKKNILVLTVGVGTDVGSLIPDPDPDRPGDYVRDRQGNVVKSRLEEKGLQEIARLTNGRYLKLGGQPLAASVVRELFAALQAQTNAAREKVKPIERFYWPLSMAIVFLMIAWFIRSSALPRVLAPVWVALLLGAVTTSLQAEPVTQPPLSRAQKLAREAREAWQQNDHQRAAQLLEQLAKDPSAKQLRPAYAQGLGTLRLKLKDYDQAVDAFSQALESSEPDLQTRAHQGLAHSLYEQGDKILSKQPKFTLKAWRDSLRHFDAALDKEPHDSKLRENREFVKKRLDELQQQMDQQQQQQKGDKGQKGDKQKGQKGEKGESGESGDQNEEGESGEGDEENKSDRSREESLGKQEGPPKDEPLPEGQLQAGKEGESGEEQQGKPEEGESADDQEQETGFSRNAARAFLRTYADDQKKAQLVRPRAPAVNGKDW